MTTRDPSRKRPSPYAPPAVPDHPFPEEVLARKAREPVRTAMFTVALVAILAGSIIFFGPLAGIIVAGVLSATLAWLYRVTTRSPELLNPARTAGGTTCPSCGSMQTDQQWMRTMEGTEELRWVCFACDHSRPV